MPFDPLYLTESVITLGETDYAAEVSSATFSPTYTTATWKGLKAGSTFTKSGKGTWVLNLSFAQDYESAQSLALYLFDHEGEEITYTVQPIDGGAGFSGTLIAQAGDIGGTVDQFAEATVALPVTGKPTRTAPAGA